MATGQSSQLTDDRELRFPEPHNFRDKGFGNRVAMQPLGRPTFSRSGGTFPCGYFFLGVSARFGCRRQVLVYGQGVHCRKLRRRLSFGRLSFGLLRVWHRCVLGRFWVCRMQCGGLLMLRRLPRSFSKPFYPRTAWKRNRNRNPNPNYHWNLLLVCRLQTPAACGRAGVRLLCGSLPRP